METYTEELIEEYEYYEEDERIQYKDSTYDIVSCVRRSERSPRPAKLSSRSA